MTAHTRPAGTIRVVPANPRPDRTARPAKPAKTTRKTTQKAATDTATPKRTRKPSTKSADRGETSRSVRVGSKHASDDRTSTGNRPQQDSQRIRVRGARVHNLRSVDVDFPKNSLVVFCGVSGSGKSSLAFDTIFAEGQRRYVESLSAYARQFLDRVGKPDVDFIEGLAPAVAIDQKSTGHNPRSTVGTITEIWDYLRVLYARIGVVHCSDCRRPLTTNTPTGIVDAILTGSAGQDITLLAPLVADRKGTHSELIERLRNQGFTRIRLDGTIRRLDDIGSLDARKRHRIDLVVDRVHVEAAKRQRLTEAVETALRQTGGFVIVVDAGGEHAHSTQLACPDCRKGIPVPEPRTFSFNSPYGACPDCSGLGSSVRASAELAVIDSELSIRGGALTPWFESAGWPHFERITGQLLAARGETLDTPYRELSDKTKHLILEGDRDIVVTAEFTTRFSTRSYLAEFEGLLPWVTRRHQETIGERLNERFARFMIDTPCRTCKGARLRPEALGVTLGAHSIAELAHMPVAQLSDFFARLELSERDLQVADRALRDVRERLGFLTEVGLGYLSLDRAASTLSGGESQRIRLASQVGSGLTGVLYVLDEPSIGLHSRDNAALLGTLLRLRDLGNTVIVVEHDEETLLASDWVVEVGPRAGVHGGTIVYSGTVEHLAAADTITGDYLSGRRSIPTPQKRRTGRGWMTVREPRGNNLRIDEVRFPIGALTVVTGVSGSGKSTLVNDTFAAALSRKLHRTPVLPSQHRSLTCDETIDKLVIVDQTPIGRTPRSNPATYTGVFDSVRELFATTETARERGYKPGRFSFNVPASSGGGRCEGCSGEGVLRIEMSFLPDVFVPCESCSGTRFDATTREVLYRGKSIDQILHMTVDEAVDFFAAVSKVRRPLQVVRDVGLGYLRLGQPATTLSGGEAQRVKLATELLRRATGRTVYVLDEPTTGLHADDVARLLSVLDRLVEAGNSVIVVEHNLDVIRCADHVIDLGPDGGPDGGRVVTYGTPEHVSQNTESRTAPYLAEALRIASRRQITQET